MPKQTLAAFILACFMLIYKEPLNRADANQSKCVLGGLGYGSINQSHLFTEKNSPSLRCVLLLLLQVLSG